MSQYRITGTIHGHYGTTVKIRAHHALTGAMLAETETVTGDYALVMAENADCYLVLLPNMGDVWRTGRFHGLGDKVYPPNYQAVPYYFICTGAGAVGRNAPAFTTQPLVTLKDGNCIWQRAERLPYPLIHFPATPVIF